MTKIQDNELEYVYVPDTKKLDISPISNTRFSNIQDIRSHLNLKWWSEVELRLLNTDDSPAYYINDIKTNHVLMRYINKNRPHVSVTFESSANMIEFDTWICASHTELLNKLQEIQDIKVNILNIYNLKEAPAYVTEKELIVDFINPIDDKIMDLHNESWKSTSKTLKILQSLLEKWDKGKVTPYWLDLTTPKRIWYILDVQKKLPDDILKLTQTTAHQFTCSTSSFSTTIWLDQQLKNYLTYRFYEYNKSLSYFTKERWAQRRKVVEYRNKHKVWVKWWYEPTSPWSNYYKSVKIKYFDNEEMDGFTLGHVPSSMSHQVQSLKFAISSSWELLPRTEFRAQDSLESVLDAQYKIDDMLIDFCNSPFAQYPLVHYKQISKKHEK